MARRLATESRELGQALPRRQGRLVSIIRELETTGPNLAEISRRLGEPKESITYRFKSAIEKNGYAVQARIDLSALGLQGAMAVVDVADAYADKVGDIFDGMDDRWYLTGFSRTLPDGRFVFHFCMPEDHYGELHRMLDGLVDSGLITRVRTVARFSWRRHTKMRAELFDFRRGRWDFDWSQVPQNPPRFEAPERSARQKFDSTDISIVASLLGNANTPLKAIAKHIRVSSKTAYRHAEHIQRAGLIKGYGVNWLRNQMNADLGRPFAPRHRIAFTNVLVSSVTPEEQARLSEKLSVLPFLWFEAGGEDYLAEIGIPLEQMVETMSYLREVLEPVAERSLSLMEDSGFSRGYSPPRFLVDDSTGGWIWDLDEQMRMLEGQLRVAESEKRVRGSPS
jgi:DNA-binding Lrp family transcriptional regulator